MKYEFIITFDSQWLMSQRENDVLPSDWICARAQKEFESMIVSYTCSLEEYSVIMNVDSEHDADDTLSTLGRLLREQYELADDTDAFVMQRRELSTAQLEQSLEKSVSIPQIDCLENEPDPDRETALDRIHNLIGAAEFKEIADECCNIAPRLRSNNLLDAFTQRAYLISVNEGCGLTKYLGLFAELIAECKLFSFRGSKEVVEVRLESPSDKTNTDTVFAAALMLFSEKSTQKIICIDISEWMTKTHDVAFRNFLKAIEAHAGRNIVFFRVPFVERNVLSDIRDNINDILFVKSFSIVPFSNDELMLFAEKAFAERGFTLTDAARRLFQARIIEEKNDGRFYGVNTVQKIMLEALYLKQLSDCANDSDDKCITDSDIRGLANVDYDALASGMQQLSELVGMENVQKKVLEIVAQIETALQNDGIESPCLHMRFVGSPGTGKTTVARIIGTILKEKGILRNGSFFEHAGRDFCGRYIGETAPKTSAICRDAYGSVLFIDEAYSLYRDTHQNTNDYGREALDTLIAEMENHRSDFMVIMAGYPDEMDTLMQGNLGLKSRMPFLLEFPNYTRQQLTEIFFHMAQKSFRYDDTFANAVRDYFRSLSEEVITSKEFSNGRFVRNLYERTWGKAALRCQMQNQPCCDLTVDDFRLAVTDNEFQAAVGKKRTIGF